MDEPPPQKWIIWTLAYMGFVIAVTFVGMRVWPRLGPWIWAHI